MKKVVESENLQVTPLSSVSEQKYYGVINKNSKGFIGRKAYCGGEFCVFCAEAVTQGNTWSDYDNKSLKRVVSNLLNTKTFTIYEFDTYSDLFKWLGE
jgi:hypothetical protein